MLIADTSLDNHPTDTPPDEIIGGGYITTTNHNTLRTGNEN